MSEDMDAMGTAVFPAEVWLIGPPEVAGGPDREWHTFLDYVSHEKDHGKITQNRPKIDQNRPQNSSD